MGWGKGWKNFDIIGLIEKSNFRGEECPKNTIYRGDCLKRGPESGVFEGQGVVPQFTLCFDSKL